MSRYLIISFRTNILLIVLNSLCHLVDRVHNIPHFSLKIINYRRIKHLPENVSIEGDTGCCLDVLMQSLVTVRVKTAAREDCL